MKESLQSVIRTCHKALFTRAIPDHIALYFHSLEPTVYGRFEDLVSYFRSKNYQFSGPMEYVTASAKTVFISFDDNYASWHNALPFLERLQVRATFYVNTLPFRDRASSAEVAAYVRRIAHVGDQRTLSTTELGEMSGAGHIIGCHSHSHLVLSTLPRSQAHEEILRSKELLEEILSSSVQHFSYPYGMRRHFSESLRAYCRMSGFLTISNAIPGLQHLKRDASAIQRSPWHLELDLDTNIENITIDGSLFEAITGRSAVG